MDPNQGIRVSPLRLFGVMGNFRQEGGNSFLKGLLWGRVDDGLVSERDKV